MPDIVHRVGIGARPEKVFEALTNLDGIRRWWVSDAKGDAREGGVFTLFGHDFKVVSPEPCEGPRPRRGNSALTQEPSQGLQWKCISGSNEWLDTEITFDMRWDKDQTFVKLTHARWKEPVDFMYHCGTKWAVVLLSLKDYVETGKGRPAPDDIRIFVGERVKK